MKAYFLIFLLAPFLASAFLFLLPKLKESTVKGITLLCLILPIISLALALGYFWQDGAFEQSIYTWHFGHEVFEVCFFVNELGLVMAGLTAFLSIIVGRFSSFYLHRDPGFQRSFRIILLFVFGMYLLSFAGTPDIFFAGWELVGFSSFLLIGFYRKQNRPVQNALRVFIVYRICDVGLLMSSVLAHILWHGANRFIVLANLTPHDIHAISPGLFLIVGALTIFASIGKSAQFPFFNWPARAIEGPTPSSAIFYGALSIHCGVFLLIRTYSLWGHVPSLRIVVGAIGILTAFLASGTGRIQANIKGQIAYASVAQIGLMYFELSLGFTHFVLLHMTLHCLLRCYQFLVSPSIISEYTKLHKYEASQNRGFPFESFLPKKLTYGLYMLAINEGGVEFSERGGWFLSATEATRILRTALKNQWAKYLLLPIVTFGLFYAFHSSVQNSVMYALQTLCLALIFETTISQEDALKTWIQMGLSICTIVLLLHIKFGPHVEGMYLYLLGIGPSLLVGTWSLWRAGKTSLFGFSCKIEKSEWNALLFLIACVGVGGLPLSISFIGEDVLLSSLLSSDIYLLFIVGTAIMLSGIVSFRIYAKVFLGRSTT